jgi:hypothetical protein
LLAHDIRARLIQNAKLTVHVITCEERVTAAYIYTLLRLPWLARDITTAIVNGRPPPQLNAMKLMLLTGCQATGLNSERCSALAENKSSVLWAAVCLPVQCRLRSAHKSKPRNAARKTSAAPSTSCNAHFVRCGRQRFFTNRIELSS